MGHFNINEDKYNWSSLLGKRNARDRVRRISQIVPKKNGPCLTKTLRWKIAKLRMRTEMEEQFYTTLFHFIITWCNNTNKYNWSSFTHLCWKEHIPSNNNLYPRFSIEQTWESVSLASLARQKSICYQFSSYCTACWTIYDFLCIAWCTGMLDHQDLFPVFSSVVDAEDANQPIYHLYMTMLFKT